MTVRNATILLVSSENEGNAGKQANRYSKDHKTVMVSWTMLSKLEKGNSGEQQEEQQPQSCYKFSYPVHPTYYITSTWPSQREIPATGTLMTGEVGNRTRRRPDQGWLTHTQPFSTEKQAQTSS